MTYESFVGGVCPLSPGAGKSRRRLRGHRGYAIRCGGALDAALLWPSSSCAGSEPGERLTLLV
jgi:hypothetical protein